MTHFLASETKELWPVMLDCVSGELCVGNFSVNSGELGVEQKLHRVVKEKKISGLLAKWKHSRHCKFQSPDAWKYWTPNLLNWEWLRSVHCNLSVISKDAAGIGDVEHEQFCCRSWHHWDLAQRRRELSSEGGLLSELMLFVLNFAG